MKLIPCTESGDHWRGLKSNRGEHILEEELDERFREFKRLVATWSRETIAMVRPYAHHDPSEIKMLNLMLVRTISSKWSIEILTMLHLGKSARFEELRKAAKGISSRVLSRKLKMMESSGLIRRKIFDTRPPRAQYMLTEKGSTLTILGTPVILFLRFKEGFYSPQDSTQVIRLPTSSPVNSRWRNRRVEHKPVLMG